MTIKGQSPLLYVGLGWKETSWGPHAMTPPIWSCAHTGSFLVWLSSSFPSPHEPRGKEPQDSEPKDVDSRTGFPVESD